MGLPPLDPMAGPAMPLGQVSTFSYFLYSMHADAFSAGILSCGDGKTDCTGFAASLAAMSLLDVRWQADKIGCDAVC